MIHMLQLPYLGDMQRQSQAIVVRHLKRRKINLGVSNLIMPPMTRLGYDYIAYRRRAAEVYPDYPSSIILELNGRFDAFSHSIFIHPPVQASNQRAFVGRVSFHLL